MIRGFWDAIGDWLKRVPITDPVDRRNAPFVQVLFLFIGCTIPLIKLWYLYLVLFAGVHAKYSGLVQVVDFGTDALMTATAWTGFLLVRRGRLRQAMMVFLGVFLGSAAAGYVVAGLARLPLTDPILLLALALAGQVLGRRALWTVWGVLLACLILGAVSDVLVRGQAEHLLILLGRLMNRAIVYLLIAILLDQTMAALRESLAESNARGLALQQANLLMQHEMVERERAQGQLIHAQKMEAVGRLAGGVAHDFDNVLNVVLGYAMRRERLADQGSSALLGALEGVELASRRGLAISRKLLNFSRQDVSHPEVFDAVQVLREMQPMLRQLFDANTRLQMEIGESHLPVCLDRGQFELMMLNIAANARDAMPSGGSFTVSARHAEPSVLEVVLADTGSGMPESVRQHVFEPFYTTKPLGQGTGLGLAVVQDMIRAADGTIMVESTPDQGTAFRIRLPLAAA